MRTLGVDLHKRFAEVAVCEDGEVRRSGRVEMEDLDAFAASLGPDDHVVVESTSVTWQRSRRIVLSGTSWLTSRTLGSASGWL